MMRRSGVDAVAYSEDLSVMGFTEVARGSIPSCAECSGRRRVRSKMRTFSWRSMLLTSMIRPARVAKKRASLLCSCLQVWLGAAGQRNSRLAARCSVFTFEPPIYRQQGGEARCIGHPLAQTIEPLSTRGEGLILSPGSRLQEIQHVWPAMRKVAEVGSAFNCSADSSGSKPGLGSRVV